MATTTITTSHEATVSHTLKRKRARSWDSACDANAYSTPSLAKRQCQTSSPLLLDSCNLSLPATQLRTVAPTDATSPPLPASPRSWRRHASDSLISHPSTPTRDPKPPTTPVHQYSRAAHQTNPAPPLLECSANINAHSDCLGRSSPISSSCDDYESRTDTLASRLTPMDHETPMTPLEFVYEDWDPEFGEKVQMVYQASCSEHSYRQQKYGADVANLWKRGSTPEEARDRWAKKKAVDMAAHQSISDSEEGE